MQGLTPIGTMRRNAVQLILALLLAGGCDWLADPAPNEARLFVQGEAGKEVRLIISTEFVAVVNELQQTRVEIFAADTLFTTLPYERVYTIEDDQRFFAEVARADDDVESVHMQVFVDDRPRFDEAGVLLDGSPYRFVYAFNQAFTREILVL